MSIGISSRCICWSVSFGITFWYLLVICCFRFVRCRIIWRVVMNNWRVILSLSRVCLILILKIKVRYRCTIWFSLTVCWWRYWIRRNFRCWFVYVAIVVNGERVVRCIIILSYRIFTSVLVFFIFSIKYCVNIFVIATCCFVFSGWCRCRVRRVSNCYVVFCCVSFINMIRILSAFLRILMLRWSGCAITAYSSIYLKYWDFCWIIYALLMFNW